MSAAPEVFLSHARYGKDKVRVFRIVREQSADGGKWHQVVEYNVQALLEGDIETSYTQADNSVVVATDSIKNITNYLAKTSPHVLSPTRFALHLGTHLVSKYAHIHKAFIEVEQLKWSRIRVDDGQGGLKPHGYSFVRDGDEKIVFNIEVDACQGKDKLVGKVTGGLKDLLVLKSSGSAFTSFLRDEYTTLAEVDDRIFSTSIDASYIFTPIQITSPTDDKKLEFVVPKPEAISAGSVWDDAVSERVKNATLKTFAEDESESVQATLYKTATLVLTENPDVQSVSYKLPNKHYIPVDLKYIGIDNLTPSKAEVFTPVAAPSGLITATISRK